MGTPHPVDVHVGNRIRIQRTLVGMSQTELGKAAGIAFQQVQKYEKGSNRCSASRLWIFAKALGVTPGFFFEDLPADDSAPDERLSRRESLELLKDYYRIGTKASRVAIRELVRSLGKEHPAQAEG